MINKSSIKIYKKWMQKKYIIFKVLKYFRFVIFPFVRIWIRFVLKNQLFWKVVDDPDLQNISYKFKVKTNFGMTITGSTQDLIQRYIYYFGVWEPSLTHYITYCLKRGDIFVDIGANIGYFSLYGSKLVGNTGEVIAFEASPKIFGELRKNVNRNNLKNVRMLNIAISNAEGSVKIYRGSADNLGRSSLFFNEGLNLEGEIKAMPLCSIITNEEMKKVRLIKIDVEGAEWLVVDGLRKLLGGCRQDLEIVVEINRVPLSRQGKSPEDIIQFFSDYGFNAYRLENDYSPITYLYPVEEKQIRRIYNSISDQEDVIFSKKNEEILQLSK